MIVPVPFQATQVNMIGIRKMKKNGNIFFCLYINFSISFPAKSNLHLKAGDLKAAIDYGHCGRRRPQVCTGSNAQQVFVLVNCFTSFFVRIPSKKLSILFLF